MEYLIINIVYLNHNNYAVYSSSSNYNGNYYTGYSSNYLNAVYLDADQPTCKDPKCECNLNKKKLKKQIKKSIKQNIKQNLKQNLKQNQKPGWLNRWFSSSSSANSARSDANKDRSNMNNNNGMFVNIY